MSLYGSAVDLHRRGLELLTRLDQICAYLRNVILGMGQFLRGDRSVLQQVGTAPVVILRTFQFDLALRDLSAQLIGSGEPGAHFTDRPREPRVRVAHGNSRIGGIEFQKSLLATHALSVIGSE